MIEDLHTYRDTDLTVDALVEKLAEVINVVNNLESEIHELKEENTRLKLDIKTINSVSGLEI